MSETRPRVFPTPQQQKELLDEKAKKTSFEAEKKSATDEIYTNSASQDKTSSSYAEAVEMMRRRTQQEFQLKEEVGVIQYPDLAEPETKTKALSKQELEIIEIKKKAEEQMKIRDEHFAKNLNQTQNYQKQYEEASTRKQQPMQETSYQPKTTAKKAESYGEVPSGLNPYLMELSQPNYNSPFDVIPLPSQGKVYPNKKGNIRVSFMTTADENILTSPNLLKSGKFLEILINRKVLEPELRYKDLTVGDRDAIMIWLRATAYGEMYPVTMLDEDGNAFETEFNLNDLKIKNLGAEPDAEGLFDFNMKLSRSSVKFKLLTCGDVDEIEEKVKKDEENEVPVDNSSTYKLEKMIVEVNGIRDRNAIRDFVSSIRIPDAKEFNAYVEKIQSGVDMQVTVGTPRGGSITTFLPINIKFFWPDFRLQA